MKIFAKNLNNYVDKDLVFSGFIDNIRDLQYVQFIIMRDSTGKVQVTIEKNDNNKVLNDLVSSLSLESTIKVTGKLLKNDNVKLNGMEIIPGNIEVTSRALPELPIDIKNKDAALRETRLDYRFLDLRREDNNLLFKVQTSLEHSMREFWINEGFMEIHTPKISGAGAESGAEMFKLDYFGTTACLSQSPQFYKQMVLASGFDKVFEIGPAFRAENSHTSYHATEINMIDVEMAWIDSEEDVMDHEEALIKYAFSKINEKYKDDIKRLFNIEIDNYEVNFPRISFSEAKKIIKDKYNYEAENKLDFERKEEELICKYVKEEYKSDFVFITKYPYSCRPFYHMLDENGLTRSFDLLYRGLEITTGAQREHRVDILEQQVKGKGIDVKSVQFYIDFFKYGCPPHGGFAIGTGRILMQMLGIDNIREATLIYRGPTRLNP